MLSHLPLSWHLPPARFMLCTMPYFWMTARYAALVYWLPRSECTMALYLLYPAVQRVDRNLQLLCCCFCWSKVFGELDRLHFVFLVVFSLLWHLRILHFSFFLFYSLVAYVSSFIIQDQFTLLLLWFCWNDTIILIFQTRSNHRFAIPMIVEPMRNQYRLIGNPLSFFAAQQLGLKSAPAETGTKEKIRNPLRT